ncbi:MAG: methylated-DNA--[protein]-cysteine S-methyltransferase [Candidatus Eremiobacteraeota bacterium]|nr:methylated-DNA--[protein]-cysteine S-methyltransferase [Candidatus Eremiobacteraeota bacterium]
MLRRFVKTPVGPLAITVSSEGRLVEISLRKPSRDLVETTPNDAARHCIEVTAAQLLEYFDGERKTFDLPLHPHGTEFEVRVWRRLCEIPYGFTTSYGALAKELGLMNGARAIGRANGSNPIPIVIPCHRVIGTNGTLVGFGGGLQMKRALLELEGSLCPEPLRLM